MKYKKIVLIILIICWMTTVFMLSGENAEKSETTSGSVVGFIVDKIYDTSNMSQKEREDKIENLQRPIRKLAHFTIYAIGGVITFMFMNDLNITNKRKILYSIMFCLIYATTDEIHQHYVPGRSCEIRDVLIDTIGASIGILITYLIYRHNVNFEDTYLK